MAARALWKGHLKVAELNCAVALYAAASTSERISFHTLNRNTGNRVRRQYVDEETGEPVEREEQVKGYETSKDKYVVIEPEEIAETAPESDKTLDMEAFLACADVDTVYFDRPYYLAPADGDRRNGVRGAARRHEARRAWPRWPAPCCFAACARLLIRAQGRGLVANTLHFDYEVRAASRSLRRHSRHQDRGRNARPGQAHHRDEGRQIRPERLRRPL